MKAIYKRELASYFRSPVGWIVITLFVLLGGFYFSFAMQSSLSVDIGSEIIWLEPVFFIVIPLITMRLFSEEKKNGTEVLLFTSAVPLYKIVLGKYLAALSLIVIMLSSSILHIILVAVMGGLLNASTLGAYIGFVLLAAVFISIGLMASALTENQIIAAVVSIVIILFTALLSLIASAVESIFVSTASMSNFLNLSSESINRAGENIARAINWFDPFARTNPFSLGIFSISPLVFCLSQVALFLYITYRILEKRRWSQS